MPGGKPTGVSERTMTYCVVPFELAPKLHDVLREHFAADPSVEVVVEQRAADRRSSGERRTLAEQPLRERRKVRGERGRRAGERRATTVPSTPPPLPRQARRYAAELSFIERFEPASQDAEDLDTARVVARLQGGDKEAFAVLYTRYFDRVYSYVKLLLGDAHEAEDATQQIFVQVFERVEQYERRPGHPFRAWLFVAVKNYTLTYLRKRGRVDVMEPAEVDSRRQDFEFVGEEPEPLRWISDRELVLFVNRLPLPQRQVLLLRFMVGLKSREIAEVLGRSPESVRTLQFRALTYLRTRLAAVDEGSHSRRRAPLRGVVRKATVLRSRRYALFV